MDSIGQIIKAHRLEKKMTQEELGTLVYVSKQAVSKWETGRTCPDIEMIRKLCDILDISKDEILGGSVKETKKVRKWSRLWETLAIIGMAVFLWSILDVPGFIDRNTQSGVAYLEVYVDGQILPTSRCQTDASFDGEKIRVQDLENAFKFDIDYGQLRGVLFLEDGTQIEYGLINVNNWHNVRIRLDLEYEQDTVYVRRTICYETDNDHFDVDVDEYVGSVGGFLSAYRPGV